MQRVLRAVELDALLGLLRYVRSKVRDIITAALAKLLSIRKSTAQHTRQDAMAQMPGRLQGEAGAESPPPTFCRHDLRQRAKDEIHQQRDALLHCGTW